MDASVDTRKIAHSRSEYKNQRAGKFLKSIDMSEMPKGFYLLTIEADNKVLHQFQVLEFVLAGDGRWGGGLQG